MEVSRLGIDVRLVDSLRREGIERLFPVQTSVVPYLLDNNRADCIFPQDICVSAPTGSGKTLTYAIPVLHVLLRRGVTRLRALIILPSRELARQVHQVFSTIASSTDLKVGLSTGHNSFEEDQRNLVGHVSDPLRRDTLFSNDHLFEDTPDALGRSMIDILICTPGRLQDHVQYTPGFTLQHLRFLILDEADRLLENAYHSWVRTIVKSTHSGGLIAATSASSADLQTDPAYGSRDPVEWLFRHKRPLQRLLFSATMTDNPGKLALLGILNPIIIKIGGDEGAVTDSAVDQESPSERPHDPSYQYLLPASLSEYSCSCETANRPLVLLALLFEAMGLSPASKHDFNMRNAKNMCVIFTSSIDGTHRLARLLQLCNRQHMPWTSPSDLVFQGKVCEMSRIVDNEGRKRILEEAAKGTVRVLVSSDHMSRGIDLKNIGLVVNYDLPSQAKTYVHRVGRTARAGRPGVAVTMLKKGQGGLFRKVRSEISGGSLSSDGKVFKVNVQSSIDVVQSTYNEAISLLPRVFSLEEEGLLKRTMELTPGTVD